MEQTQHKKVGIIGGMGPLATADLFEKITHLTKADADSKHIHVIIVRGNVLRCIEQGMLDPESFETHSEPKDVFELYRREDIDLLRGALPVTQLHFVASDGFTNHIRETVDAMDDAVYAVWLRYCLATCERQDMVGCSHHTIDIFRKNT